MEPKLAPVIDAGDALPLTIGGLSRARARTEAERVLLVCDSASLTYAEADARSRRLARALLTAGVTKGSHVGLLLPNSPDFLVAVLAVTRIGAVVLPFSTLSTTEELRVLLANSDTSFLLAATEFRSHNYMQLLQELIPELDLSQPGPLRAPSMPWLRRIWFYGSSPGDAHPDWSVEAIEPLSERIEDSLLDAVEARVSPADRAVIIHTSGSTGAPKGVMHTHGAVIRHRSNLNLMRGFDRDDVLFSPAPWFWITGFSFSLLGTMIAGARLVYSNSLIASEVLDLLERERPTLANGYPPTAARLAADPSFGRRDLTSIRRGNLISLMPEAIRPRDQGLRHEGYGMTEAGSAMTCGPDDVELPESLRGSNGPFAPGFETRIVDPQTGEDCPLGRSGELWIRGPFVMDGYYGRARSEVFDADGWYHTSDIGRISDDGLFFMEGRTNDMIKSALANVSPREVEAVLRGLTDGAPCLVLGVRDEERGQAVIAILVTEDASAYDEAVLKREMAKKLSSYKVPRRVLFLKASDLPVLASGKVNMRLLVDWAQSRWRQEGLILSDR